MALDQCVVYHEADLPSLFLEVQIRTISVSLLAVVAVTTGILLSRTREVTDEAPESPSSQGTIQLEALRQAGI